MKLHWAASVTDNLVLSLTPMAPPKHLFTDPEPPHAFARVINESSKPAFEAYKRPTTSLLAAGIFKGTEIFMTHN